MGGLGGGRGVVGVAEAGGASRGGCGGEGQAAAGAGTGEGAGVTLGEAVAEEGEGEAGSAASVVEPEGERGSATVAEAEAEAERAVRGEVLTEGECNAVAGVGGDDDASWDAALTAALQRPPDGGVKRGEAGTAILCSRCCSEEEEVEVEKKDDP